jgi:putative tricarboxylic transport membrane protein
MDLDPIIKGVTLVASPESLLLIFASVVGGVLVGALPGLSSTMAIALLMPFTIGLNPVLAISMMAALYCAGTYGGSITAILINTPGAPPAVATSFDGYPMAQRGEAGRALGMAAIASVIGGIFSLIVFIVAAPLLGKVALSFRPPEYFALTLFGLSMLAAISGESSIRNLISGALGVLVSTVGIALVTGTERFTFGLAPLYDGIDFVPVLIGIFAVSELLNQSQAVERGEKRIRQAVLRLPSREDLRKCKGTILRSSIIGTFIGILPAEGTTVAAIIGYNEAKRWSKHPEEFGKGAIEGIAGAETANNAGTGGAMVPTLALGIPGSGATAVMLAAMIMHGLRPGPYLMRETPEFLYAIFTAMLIANFAFLFVGLAGAKVFALITIIPRTFLWPAVFVFALVGAYAYRQASIDVWVGPAPFVMGLVLGGLLEKSWSQAMIIFDSHWLLFFASPIADVFFGLTLLSMLSPIIGGRWVRLLQIPMRRFVPKRSLLDE